MIEDKGIEVTNIEYKFDFKTIEHIYKCCNKIDNLNCENCFFKKDFSCKSNISKLLYAISKKIKENNIKISSNIDLNDIEIAYAVCNKTILIDEKIGEIDYTKSEEEDCPYFNTYPYQDCLKRMTKYTYYLAEDLKKFQEPSLLLIKEKKEIDTERSQLDKELFIIKNKIEDAKTRSNEIDIKLRK